MRITRTILATFASFIFITISIFFLPVCTYVYAWPDYETGSFENIHAAVAALGQTKSVLLVRGRHRISRNLLVPCNITLRFLQDAAIFVEDGKNVEIRSPIQAPASRIFEGTGHVSLKQSEAYPQWWGARADGIHDDGFALQSAIDALHDGGGGVVRLPVGTYLLNHVTGAYYAIKGKDKVSVIGDGKDSILKVGNHLRTAARGVAVLYNHEELVSQCRYAHFAVDYNGNTNLRSASWGSSAKASNVSRMGAEFASDIIIEDVHFKDVTGAHCVWFGNYATNHRNVIRNCSVSNVGQSVPGNQLADHSSIYIGGTDGLVSGNVFHNQTPCNISTAIEVHSSATIVSNNVVTNYSTAVNIGGEANDCSNITLSDNIFRNCRNGIVFWHWTPYHIKNIVISNNIISIRESDAARYPPSMGIIYGGAYITSKTNMNGLRILNNTISQETSTISGQQPHTAIYLRSIDNVTITGNTIYNFNGEAVYMESQSPGQGMTGVIISDNKIRNVGITSKQNRKRAIAFNSYQTASGSIKDILVQNNTISGGERSPMHNGITFNNGYFKNVKVSGNVISNISSYGIVNNSTGRDQNFYIDCSGNHEDYGHHGQ